MENEKELNAVDQWRLLYAVNVQSAPEDLGLNS